MNCRYDVRHSAKQSSHLGYSDTLVAAYHNSFQCFIGAVNRLVISRQSHFLPVRMVSVYCKTLFEPATDHSVGYIGPAACNVGLQSLQDATCLHESHSDRGNNWLG